MYNRYIPQPDGSYERSRIPEQSTPQRSMPRREPAPPPKPASEPDCNTQPWQACTHMRPARPLASQGHDKPKQVGSLGGFLRQLVPKNIDIEDLLIIILLLLISGDCAEDQNAALLTLAIYLFL